MTLSKIDIQNLEQAIGSENVSDQTDLRELYSQDIWSKGETAELVISPVNTEQLAAAVKLAAERKLALHPRGGGMSYTNGYTPKAPGSAILDFTKMDKILEINADDMYVTVQAGCTWKTLYEALKPLGLRTPFWGPLSGLSSTVCGGLSQNNAFFGSGTFDTSTVSVTSITVVLADGSIVKTGTGGGKNAKPFYRHYGPDLTGLFMGDAGALGYKAEATLRLIPMPPSEDWASFEFPARENWASALADMGRLGLASELFGFDPVLQAVRMKRASLTADFKALANVVTGQKGGLLKGIKEGIKVSLAGRSYMDDVAFSIHFVVEGHSDAEVAAKLDTLKTIAKDHNGSEIENSIPTIIRSSPFVPLNTILGPEGERWVPVHGIVAMGDGPSCVKDIDDWFSENAADMEKYEITAGYLMTTMSTNGYLIEPVFIWPEELFEIHRQTVENSTLKRVKAFDPNPEATSCVKRLRAGVIDIFSKYGAAHFQVGRTYPYRETRGGSSWALLEKIKSALDPDGTVNPGSLGLG